MQRVWSYVAIDLRFGRKRFQLHPAHAYLMMPYAFVTHVSAT